MRERLPQPAQEEDTNENKCVCLQWCYVAVCGCEPRCRGNSKHYTCNKNTFFIKRIILGNISLSAAKPSDLEDGADTYKGNTKYNKHLEKVTLVCYLRTKLIQCTQDPLEVIDVITKLYRKVRGNARTLVRNVIVLLGLLQNMRATLSNVKKESLVCYCIVYCVGMSLFKMPFKREK